MQVLATRQEPGLRWPAPLAGVLLLGLAVPGLALAQAGRPTRPAAARSTCTVVASAKPATLTLDANGAATLAPDALDNGSITCGTGTFSASRTSFGCADLNPAALPAVRRGSLQLDRTNNQYVLSNNQVSGTTTGTFETWVKTTVALPQFSGILVTSTAAGDAASGAGIYLRWDGGGRVACEGAWAVAQTGSSPGLNDGQWHHLAAVGEGNTCKLYIDGVLNATGTATPNQSYSRRIMLGAERSRTAGFFGTVELDNSRVWSVPRTPAQIQDGMAYETLANTYGLLLAYTYDNGAGNTVRDVSGNNRPARLYGDNSVLPTFTPAGGVPLLPRGVPVTLTVTDTDGTTSTADTYVTVLPATPPATALTFSGSSVPENSAVGTVVGTLAFNPGACPSSGITFELVPAAGTDYARFSLGTGATAGQLLLATVPDYETQPSYTLRLRATDQNYATVDQMVTIAVEDLIELSGTQTAACGSTGATATVAVAGTATGYAYSWSPTPGGGQGTATATGLVAGTYTVSVSKTGLTTATRDFVIVNDAVLPVALAKNVTLTLDANGAATLAAATLDDGSTDNCGIAGRSVSRSAFTCADLNPAALPAVRRGSLLLDRANSQYVLSNNQVSGSTTGTFETWVKTTVALPQYSGILVTSTAAGDAASGTGIYLRWDGGGRVACEGAWAVAQTGSSPALNDGQWHHLAAVGEGNTCKLYIDGVLNATGTATPNQSYSRRIMLGAERSRTAGFFGTVELDNSRVWSVARTQAQIQESLTYEQSTDATGLLLAYTYNNGAGNTVRDMSGNNQPATLYSANSTLPTFTAAGGAPLVPRGTPVTLTVTDAAGNTSSATAYVTVQAPASAVAAARTWTGAKNTDWADCANWSYGLVPDASTNVSIPAGLNNYPALSGTNITVATLNVAAGASIAMGTTVLSVLGDLLNAGPALSGPVRLLGSAAQTLAGSLSSLTIDKTGGTTTLAANVDVSTALFLTNGRLSTDPYTLTLGSGAMLVESDANYITGTVQTTRDLSGAGTSYDIGGLGLTLAPAASSTAVPGRTLVQRVTGSPRSGVNGAASIARYFTITPTVDAGLNVDLKLSYRTAELNGIAPASLGLFKSETGASGSWAQQMAAVISTSDKTATLAGVSSFSVWTLGTTAQPLPVVLTSFTATAQDREAVRLSWATASEKNSARFEVERSADGLAFAAVSSVAAAGTTATAHTYGLLDAALPTGAATLYYRLRQVDQDGTATYSPVRTVALTGAAAGLSLYPNPATTGATLLGALPGTRATVLDALGRPVATATADAAGKATLTLPAGLTPGVYVVRAGAQALRLVVE